MQYKLHDYNSIAAATTTPAPGSPSNPTISALNAFTGKTIMLNADNPAINAPPASELISTRATPRVFNRVTHTTVPTSATAAINIKIVSQLNFTLILYARKSILGQVDPKKFRYSCFSLFRLPLPILNFSLNLIRRNLQSN